MCIIRKSKELKRYSTKILPNYKQWKTQSKIKPIKTGKEPAATYYLGCKDYTHNFKPQEVNMTNKVLRAKPDCAFVEMLGQDFENKNTATKNSFHKLQNMYIYCKNCKKHTGNTFPKELLLISKNKIKGKSKCAVCLTKSTFIHEIKKTKYDLDS